MKSAILINLDYERHNAQTCRRVWAAIADSMAGAGFSSHFRLFLADMGREDACAAAKRVIAEVEDALAHDDIFVFDVIREFYWFEYQETNDLLAPANQMAEVSFIDASDFQAFLSSGRDLN